MSFYNKVGSPQKLTIKKPTTFYHSVVQIDDILTGVCSLWEGPTFLDTNFQNSACK